MKGSRFTLTKRGIDAAEPKTKRYELWDDAAPGLGLRVQPTGAKSFVYRYRLGGGRSAKKDGVTIGTYGKVTLDQARKEARRLAGEVAAGRNPAAERNAARAAEKTGGDTIADLAARFMADHVHVERKASTAEAYQHAIDRHILPDLGKKRIGDVDAAAVRKLRLSLRTKPGMANKTVAVLSSMFTFGARNGLVKGKHNPAEGVAPFELAKRRRYLSGDELARLGEALRLAETEGLPYEVDESRPTAKHAPKPENRRTKLHPDAIAAIRLLLLTGARLREILHLRWSEVHIDRGALELADSKTGAKTIVLNAPALAILVELGKRRRGAFVFPGERFAKPAAGEEPVEQPRSDVKKPWAALSRAAALTDVRIHDLRHSHASVGVGAGLSLRIVGEILGHSTPSTTQRYAHLALDPVREAAERIGSVIAVKMGDAPAGEVIDLERRRG